MKKLILSLMLCGATLTAFCQKSEVRSVSGFTGIDVSNTFKITVSKGQAESLTITADEDLLPFVRSEVKKGVLHLYIDGKHKLKNRGNLQASIVMKELNKITLSGACNLIVNDGFTPENFKFETSGASNCKIDIKTETLNVDMSGASKLMLNANVENARFDVSGAVNLKLTLQAENVHLDVTGSPSLQLSGKADRLAIDSSGASKIDAAEFETESVYIDSSGASQISVYAKEKLKIDSSGASHISYKGNPSVEMDGSGATKIKKID
ncbi:MAG: DUF2807 domain-containing protein [Bacteroidales bacterium]|nr:DUF2807 domain-containing protein [Bacteroidales bacterium]